MRVLSLLAAATAITWGQTGPEIVKRTVETYQTLKSYRFEAQVVNELLSADSESRNRSVRSAAAVLPDRRRLELKGGPTASLRIYDGKSVWEYRPKTNEYVRAGQDGYKPPTLNFLSDPVDHFKSLEKAGEAKLLREESIEAAGGTRACWVIEISPKAQPRVSSSEQLPSRYWVDKATNLVLKHAQFYKMKMPSMDEPMTSTTTTTYSVAQVNEPVPAELFRFQPPEGAVEVAEFKPAYSRNFAGNSTAIGKPVPEFTLRDLAGKEVAISSLKGNPVLVSFWATWCAPCREQMPKIEEVQKAHADKGLVVLAINYGEDVATAKKYIEEHHYPFRALLDAGKAAAGKFSVSSIPAVILIDREGIVRGLYTGYSSRVNFLDEVKKIGL